VVENQVVLTVDGGGTLAVGGDYAICCGDWESGETRPAFKTFFYDAALETAGWKLFLDRDEIEAGESYELPAASSGAEPKLLVFIYDPVSENELGSNQANASGTITVEELDCGSPARIRVTFTDVVVPSEFHDGPAVHMSGTVEATVYENPTDIGCDFGI